jgi:hypothetical protein
MKTALKELSNLSKASMKIQLTAKGFEKFRRIYVGIYEQW